MKHVKHLLYISLALGMLIYAVPKLEIGGGFALPTLFGVAWICMALLVIAANLHHMLGVDEETRRELAKVKRMRRWETERKLSARAGLTSRR